MRLNSLDGIGDIGLIDHGTVDGCLSSIRPLTNEDGLTLPMWREGYVNLMLSLN